MAEAFDLVVLGAGPAGYTAAIRAAQLGMRVACVDGGVGPEGKPSLGGTCLNVGCIPSKALLESSEHFHRAKVDLKEHGISIAAVRMDVPAMIARKNKIVRGLASGVGTLFAKNKVVAFAGNGRLLSGMRVEVTPLAGGPIETIETITAKNILIATGSLPREIDAAAADGKLVVDSSGALDFATTPEKLGVIGAGVIGLELGSVWNRLGSKVVLLEAMDSFLPGADEQIAEVALKEMTRQGLDIRLGARVLSATAGQDKNDKVEVEYEDASGRHSIEFSKLVVAIGRKPNTQGIDVNEVGLLLDERGYIHVDEFCRTNLPNIYAVGDVALYPDRIFGGMRRTEHWENAVEQGRVAGANITGKKRVKFEYVPYRSSRLFDLHIELVGDFSRQPLRAQIEGDRKKKKFIVRHFEGAKLRAVVLCNQESSHADKARREILRAHGW